MQSKLLGGFLLFTSNKSSWINFHAKEVLATAISPPRACVMQLIRIAKFDNHRLDLLGLILTEFVL